MAREKIDYSATLQAIRDGHVTLDGRVLSEEDLFADPKLLPRAHEAIQKASGNNASKERKAVTPRPCWIGLISPDGKIVSEAETFYNQRLERDSLAESLSELSALVPGSRVLLAVEDSDKREVTIENFSIEDFKALFQG